MLGRDNLVTAAAYVRRLRESVGRLREFPFSGRIVPEFGREEIREVLQVSWHARDPKIADVIADSAAETQKQSLKWPLTVIAFSPAATALPRPPAERELGWGWIKLPVEPLATVAGLVKARDENLEQAVYRFAAQSEPNCELSPQEEEAYNSFVTVLLSRSKPAQQ